MHRSVVTRVGSNVAAMVPCGWLVTMMKRTLSAIVLSGALLAGCGGGTTVVSRTETPTVAKMSATTTPSVEPVASATASAFPAPESVTASSAPPPATTATQSIPASPSTVPVAPPSTTVQSVPAPSTQPSQPSQPPETTTPAPVGGAWAVMDVTVTTAAEADRLSQTSADFRAFVAQRVATPDASGCQSEFTVQSFHPGGFAAGQDFAPGCGGSQNIWGRVGGTWTTIMTMQSIVDCSQMERNNIPQGLPDIPCLDTNGDLADW